MNPAICILVTAEVRVS